MDRKRTARSAADGTDGRVKCGLQDCAPDGQLCAISPELVSLTMENNMVRATSPLHQSWNPFSIRDGS